MICRLSMYLYIHNSNLFSLLNQFDVLYLSEIYCRHSVCFSQKSLFCFSKNELIFLQEVQLVTASFESLSDMASVTGGAWLSGRSIPNWNITEGRSFAGTWDITEIPICMNRFLVDSPPYTCAMETRCCDVLSLWGGVPFKCCVYEPQGTNPTDSTFNTFMRNV